MKRFIEKTEHFVRRLRWRAYHFLNQQETSTKETYGFKSKNSPPKINEPVPFEEDMTNLIRNIKFKDNAKSNFQRKLDADIKNKVKKPNSLLIPADKTTNYYRMDTNAYNKLMNDFPVIGDLVMRAGLWDRQGANIGSRYKEMYGVELFLRLKPVSLDRECRILP